MTFERISQHPEGLSIESPSEQSERSEQKAETQAGRGFWGLSSDLSTGPFTGGGHNWVTHSLVYRRYQQAFPAVFAGSGGEVLVADEAPETLAGEAADKLVVMRFPNMEMARAFLDSPEYKRISVDRDAGAVTQSWMVRTL